jgi:hypothetical protein
VCTHTSKIDRTKLKINNDPRQENPKMILLHRDANLRKLSTHEDHFHVHKTLGSLSLLSFVYRYGIVYTKTGTLGFDGTVFDWLSILCHSALAVSSLLFRVPRRRITGQPLIVYEEYRQHAILFTLRSACVWVAATTMVASTLRWAAPCLVAVHHLAVDRVTAIHGTPGNTAVRSTSNIRLAAFNRMWFLGLVPRAYSFYQFLALASLILPSPRPADLAFNVIIAIQSSVFLMTLYRKRIIRGYGHLLGYSLCLVLSGFYIFRTAPHYVPIAAATGMALRIALPSGRVTKYVVWACVWLLFGCYVTRT